MTKPDDRIELPAGALEIVGTYWLNAGRDDLVKISTTRSALAQTDAVKELLDALEVFKHARQTWADWDRVSTVLSKWGRA